MGERNTSSLLARSAYDVTGASGRGRRQRWLAVGGRGDPGPGAAVQPPPAPARAPHPGHTLPPLQISLDSHVHHVGAQEEVGGDDAGLTPPVLAEPARHRGVGLLGEVAQAAVGDQDVPGRGRELGHGRPQRAAAAARYLTLQVAAQLWNLLLVAPGLQAGRGSYGQVPVTLWTDGCFTLTEVTAPFTNGPTLYDCVQAEFLYHCVRIMFSGVYIYAYVVLFRILYLIITSVRAPVARKSQQATKHTRRILKDGYIWTCLRIS